MEKLRLVKKIEDSCPLRIAANTAIRYFIDERLSLRVIGHAALMRVAASRAVETFMLYGNVEVEILPGDTADSVSRRWTTAQQKFGRPEDGSMWDGEILRGMRPELDELVSNLTISLDLGLELTLEWVRLFTKLCDKPVFDCFSSDLVRRFQQFGYSGSVPLALASAKAYQQKMMSSRELFGRHIVAQFIYELQNCTGLSKSYESDIARYENMSLTQQQSEMAI